MKLATSSELKKVTGEIQPDAQYRVLCEQLGLRPVLAGGRVRIYQETIAQAMLGQARSKPKMDEKAFQ